MYALPIHSCINLSSSYAFVYLLSVIYLSLRPLTYLSSMHSSVYYLYHLLICPSIHFSVIHVPPDLPPHRLMRPPRYSIGHITESSHQPRPLTQRGLQGVTEQIDPGHSRHSAAACPSWKGLRCHRGLCVRRGWLACGFPMSRAGSRCHVRLCVPSRTESQCPWGWTFVTKRSHLLKSWHPTPTYGFEGAAEGGTIQSLATAPGFLPWDRFSA